MTRNLKALGLALLAAFALSAIVAQAASAQPTFEAVDNSTTEPYASKATLTGFQEEENGDKFITASGELTCKKVHYDGAADIEGSQTQVELTPTFGKAGDPTNCHTITSLGTKQVTFTHNGCKLNVHPEETTEKEVKNGKFVGSFELTSCPPENPGIDMHIYNSAAKHTSNEPLCVYRMLEQTIQGIHTENVSTEVGGVKQHFVTFTTPTTAEGQAGPGAPLLLKRISGSPLTCAETLTFTYRAKDTVDAKDVGDNTRGLTITD